MLGSHKVDEMANVDFRNNSLNLIRMLAAVQVLAGHTIAHLEIVLPQWLAYALWPLKLFPGVPIFFFLSGYLIVASIERSKSVGDYSKKRFYRIYPEMWLCVGISAVVLLFLAKDLQLVPFLVFNFTQATVFQFWTPDCLRSYGVGTPNGSLWTQSVIVQFYILVWLVYRFLKNKGRTSWLIGLVIAFAISLGLQYFRKHSSIPEIGNKLLGQTVFQYIWLFWLGMGGYIYREKNNTLV